ncbi:hypothetical protein ACFLV7_04120 [Chloroflexota bacterium]
MTPGKHSRHLPANAAPTRRRKNFASTLYASQKKSYSIARKRQQRSAERVNRGGSSNARTPPFSVCGQTISTPSRSPSQFPPWLTNTNTLA